MKYYLFSGNEEWLKQAKAELGDKITTSSDYGRLLELQKDPDAILFTMHDEKHPIDVLGIKTPYLFNEFRNVEPGALKSDKFICFSDYAENMEKLKEYIAKYDELFSVFDRLASGDLKLQYNGWSFTAGHEGDSDMYDILDSSGNHYAHLDAYDDDSLEFTTSGETLYTNGWYARKNVALFERFEHLIVPCLKRDDPEICKALCDEEGRICFPRDYSDISREAILSGEWMEYATGVREIEEELEK